MKRMSALLLCAALLLTATVPAASAAPVTERNETPMEAYIDMNGRAVCVVGGEKTALPFDNVESIVHANEWAVYLTARTLEGQTALFLWSPLLSTQDSSILISAVAGDPVYVARDDAIYFLNPENARQLMKCPVDLSGSCGLVRLLPSANCQLREAMDGLNVSLAGEDGAVYYSRVLDAESGMLRVTQFDPQADWANFGDFETQITSDGGLEVRRAGETAWRFVSYDDVIAQAAMDGKLYYLTREPGGNKLFSFDPAATTAPVYMNAIGGTLQPELCAGEGCAFVIDQQGVAQAFRPGAAAAAGSWNTGALDADLALCGGKLLVYDAGSLRLEAELPWNAPRTYATLAMGSRGDGVRELQERLNELGYNAGKADGVFGGKTSSAVIYFEDAVGMTQDGIASAAVQQKLFAANAPAYEEFVELRRGGRVGVRVAALQERLRELGYQADAADGTFGARTQAAVSLFQSENGLRATGVATVETLRKLMSGGAAVCSSYIPLQKGDTGVRVTELQERLRELEYFTGEANGQYDDHLAATMRIFCQANGLKERSDATEEMQAILFAPETPVYEGFIEMWRGDYGDKVEQLQKRLYELGYFDDEINGVYGSKTRDAVKLFQRANELDVDGVAGVLTLEALYSPWAIPAYVEPEIPAEEDIDIDWHDYEESTSDDAYWDRAEADEDEPESSHEPVIDEEQLKLMLEWMNLNYAYELDEDETWDEENFIPWLKERLFELDFLEEKEFTEHPDVYDQETFDAVEAFQLMYEVGLENEDDEAYEYGVADAETLQKMLDVIAILNRQTAEAPADSAETAEAETDGAAEADGADGAEADETGADEAETTGEGQTEEE